MGVLQNDMAVFITEVDFRLQVLVGQWSVTPYRLWVALSERHLEYRQSRGRAWFQKNLDSVALPTR